MRRCESDPVLFCPVNSRWDGEITEETEETVTIAINEASEMTIRNHVTRQVILLCFPSYTRLVGLFLRGLRLKI